MIIFYLFVELSGLTRKKHKIDVLKIMITAINSPYETEQSIIWS